MSNLPPDENKGNTPEVPPAIPPELPVIIPPWKETLIESWKKAAESVPPVIDPPPLPIEEKKPSSESVDPVQKTDAPTPPPVLPPSPQEKAPVVEAPAKAQAHAAPKLPEKKEDKPGFFQRLFGGGKKKVIPSGPVPHRPPPQKIPATPPVKHQAELPLPGLQALTPVPPVLKEAAATPDIAKPKDANKTPPGQKTKPPVHPRVMAEKSVEPGRLTVTRVEANQPRARHMDTGHEEPVVPVIPGSEPKDDPQKPVPPKKRRPILTPLLTPRVIFSTILILFLAIGAYFIWQILRETRLTVKIDPGDVKIEPQAVFVLDFEQRVRMIRRDLDDRRRPIREALDEAKNSYNAAATDAKARQQTKQFLIDGIDKARKEIPALLLEANKTLTAMWNKEYAQLDSEYDREENGFTATLVQHAKELKINLQLNSPVKSPEVSANAFRLALYGAPKEIDVTKERLWVEDQLKAWRAKEEDWSKRRADIRDRSTKIRKPLGGKVEEINNRIDQMQEDLKKAEDDLALVEGEEKTFADRVSEQEELFKETLPPFLSDLLHVPEEFTQNRVSLGLNGGIDMRELENHHEYPPGKYRLLLRGTKDGEQYWALKEIEIKANTRNTYEIKPEDFKPARTLIE